MTPERHNREFWQSAARKVAAGQSVRAVAEQLGVRPKTLSWWLWRLGRERPAKRKGRKRRQETPTFLPVVVRDAHVERGLVALEVGDVRLRVEAGADVNYVVALVRALRAC